MCLLLFIRLMLNFLRICFLPLRAQETGITYEAAVARPFWELFQPPFELGGEPWRAMLDVAERAGEFAIRGCTLADAPHAGSFTITFRCGRSTGGRQCFEACRPVIWHRTSVLRAGAAAYRWRGPDELHMDDAVE